MTSDPHDILGVTPETSPEEVRRAYLVLAQIFHPDRFEHLSDDVRVEAVRRMQQVNWAYQELHSDAQTVYWDTDEGWTNEMRGQLTAALLHAGIPHRWNGNELSVHIQYENRVDAVLDRVADRHRG